MTRVLSGERPMMSERPIASQPCSPTDRGPGFRPPASVSLGVLAADDAFGVRALAVATVATPPAAHSETPMPITKSKVYVVDGDTENRKFLSRLLRTKGYTCAPFATAEDLLEAVDLQSRGCLVAGLDLPGLGGAAMQTKLRERRVALPLVGLIDRPNTRKIVAAMQGGAVTVLQRPCAIEELLEAVRLAVRKGATEWKSRQQLARTVRLYETLSDDEKNILRLIAQGISNKSIARQCELGLRTVESRRQTIFRKMQVDSLAELVRLAALVDPKL
ncbi:MAG: response regulator [Planctomycetota bacterium]|nr:MAG: response regulator [Planctomycetota bacterium]REK41064.1 MAG: response regulator [Planctomycetota bacterium]